MGLNFSQQLVTRYALEIANIVDMVSPASFILTHQSCHDNTGVLGLLGIVVVCVC